ncbi:MAG: CcmD family protein [Candidatus Zixiibacteriota bacterium]
MDGNYVAMVVTLVVWAGLFIAMIRVDKRIKKLEEKQK